MNKSIYKFETCNDWSMCQVGKCEIVVTSGGVVDHVRFRNKTRFGQEARDFVKANPRLSGAFARWSDERIEARHRWRHETPHHRFDCDGGTLAIRIDGSAVVRINCGSDGNHPVYVLRQDPPPFFIPTGTSLKSCTIEPLDYDCSGGKPLCKVAVKSAGIYRDESAIAIVIEKED